MNFSGWVYMAVCSCSVVIANVLLREGTVKSGVVLFENGLLGLPRQMIVLVTQPLLFACLFFYGVAMLIWFRLVATQPISIAYPVLATLTFVGISGAGMLLFGENVSVQKLTGLLLALTGLVVIATA